MLAHPTSESPGACLSLAREFLASYDRQAAGCLVLDVRMPEMDGLELQECLAEEGIKLPIIFITAHGDVPTCARAFKAGALEFLEKPLDGKAFLHHIRKALESAADDKRQAPAAPFAVLLDRLTPREKAVLDMLVSGKTLKEIAALSNVRVQTIWKQRLAIYKKMGVENDVELVRLVKF